MPLALNAQHYISTSLQAGYANLFDDTEVTHFNGFAGAQLSVGYLWQHNHLLLNAELGASYKLHNADIADYNIQKNMLDTEGMPFKYVGDVTGRKDNYQTVALRIPMLAGGEWDKFYFLAGFVPEFNLWGVSNANATLTTTGDYQRFYNPLTDMPNHGFYNLPLTSKQNFTYNIDVLAHLEVGFVITSDDRDEKYKYRISLFGEVGALNIAPQAYDAHLAEPNLEQYMTVQLNHPYLSKEATSAAAHQWEVGAKFTVNFKVAENKDAKQKRKRFVGRGRQMSKGTKQNKPKEETKPQKEDKKKVVVHTQTVIVVHNETDIIPGEEQVIDIKEE